VTDVPRYPFLLLDVAPPRSEDLAAQLFEYGAQGVEERDATTLIKSRRPEVVTLVASFATEEEARTAIDEFVAIPREEGDPEPAPIVEFVVGDDWRDAWKAHFKPFTLCEHAGAAIVVRPPWEAYTPSAGQKVLELEPGRAFGTGLHETTSLVAQFLIEDTRFSGKRIFDLGSGSGILALVALQLGATEVLAVDIDQEATDVAIENAERNQFASRLHAKTGELASVTETFPLVLANIEARILNPLAPELVQRVMPKGKLILSGILAFQGEEVIEHYTQAGMKHLATKARGEWVALAFENV
jgi:ribosomal protein L11 methyltransferase